MKKITEIKEVKNKIFKSLTKSVFDFYFIGERLSDEETDRLYDKAAELISKAEVGLTYVETMDILEQDGKVYVGKMLNKTTGAFYRSTDKSIYLPKSVKLEKIAYKDLRNIIHEVLHKIQDFRMQIKGDIWKFNETGFQEAITERLTDYIMQNYREECKTDYIINNMSFGKIDADNTYKLPQLILRQMELCIPDGIEKQFEILKGKRTFFNEFKEEYGEDLYKYLESTSKSFKEYTFNKNQEIDWELCKKITEAQNRILTEVFDKKFEKIEKINQAYYYLKELKEFGENRSIVPLEEVMFRVGNYEIYELDRTFQEYFLNKLNILTSNFPEIKTSDYKKIQEERYIIIKTKGKEDKYDIKELSKFLIENYESISGSEGEWLDQIVKQLNKKDRRYIIRKILKDHNEKYIGNGKEIISLLKLCSDNDLIHFLDRNYISVKNEEIKRLISNAFLQGNEAKRLKIAKILSREKGSPDHKFLAETVCNIENVDEQILETEKMLNRDEINVPTFQDLIADTEIKDADKVKKAKEYMQTERKLAAIYMCMITDTDTKMNELRLAVRKNQLMPNDVCKILKSIEDVELRIDSAKKLLDENIIDYTQWNDLLHTINSSKTIVSLYDKGIITELEKKELAYNMSQQINKIKNELEDIEKNKGENEKGAEETWQNLEEAISRIPDKDMFKTEIEKYYALTSRMNVIRIVDETSLLTDKEKLELFMKLNEHSNKCRFALCAYMLKTNNNDAIMTYLLNEEVTKDDFIKSFNNYYGDIEKRKMTKAAELLEYGIISKDDFKCLLANLKYTKNNQISRAVGNQIIDPIDAMVLRNIERKDGEEITLNQIDNYVYTLQDLKEVAQTVLLSKTRQTMKNITNKVKFWNKENEEEGR